MRRQQFIRTALTAMGLVGMRDDITKWAGVIKKANIKLD